MRRLALGLALVLGAGCAPRLTTLEVQDPFRQSREIRMRGARLACEHCDGSSLELNAESHARRGHATAYHLRVVYRDAAEWLHIRRGESLLLLVDGEVIRLSGFGSWRHRRRSLWGVREEAAYPIRRADLVRVAAAAQVRVRVLGARAYLEGTLRARHQERITALVDQTETEPERAAAK